MSEEQVIKYYYAFFENPYLRFNGVRYVSEKLTLDILYDYLIKAFKGNEFYFDDFLKLLSEVNEMYFIKKVNFNKLPAHLPVLDCFVYTNTRKINFYFKMMQDLKTKGLVEIRYESVEVKSYPKKWGEYYCVVKGIYPETHYITKALIKTI